MIHNLLAAVAAGEAPQNQFGFLEAMEQGGVIAWSIFGVLVIMSVGSFYILITKWLEQQKILNQFKKRTHVLSGGRIRCRKAARSWKRTARGANSWMMRFRPKTSTGR